MEKTAKKCPKCGVMFACNTEGDCWCHSYQIMDKDFVQLWQQYTDCLCPTCLRQYAQNPDELRENPPGSVL